VQCDGDKCRPKFYKLPVTKMSLGDEPLLVFNEESQRDKKVLATIDSGSTCVRLPNSTLNGLLASAPMDNFVAAWNRATTEQPLRIEFDGRYTADIFFDDYAVLGQTTANVPAMIPCVTTLPDDGAELLLFGIPLYSSNLIVHDLKDPAKPRVGLARRNRDREPAVGAYQTSQGIGVPLTRPKEDKLFVVQANMGTPPQGPLLLIVDTGSSSLVVFATEAPLDTTTLVLITVPALAVLASCVFACFFFRKCMCSGCDSNYQRCVAPRTASHMQRAFARSLMAFGIQRRERPWSLATGLTANTCSSLAMLDHGVCLNSI